MIPGARRGWLSIAALRVDRGFALCHWDPPTPRVFIRPGRPTSSRRRAPAATREINNRGRVTPGDCSTFLREINNITHARCCPGDFAPSAPPPPSLQWWRNGKTNEYVTTSRTYVISGLCHHVLKSTKQL